MNQYYEICTTEDDFTREQWMWKARWWAQLSNGERVFQDDDRKGREPSAWIRLRHYVKEHKLEIEDLWLQFRSNIVGNICPFRADGYFFTKSAVGIWGSSETQHYYIVGYIYGNEIYTQKWNVPALIMMEEGIRKLDHVLSNQYTANSVILNAKYTEMVGN